MEEYQFSQENVSDWLKTLVSDWLKTLVEHVSHWLNNQALKPDWLKPQELVFSWWKSQEHDFV